MSWEEKRAWIALVVAIVTFSGYCVVVLVGADGGSLEEVAYRSTFLWSIGVSIVSSIVLEALAGGSLPKGERRTDARDRQIFRDAEFAGHWLLVAGAFAAMVMALTEADHFWIANVIYLSFTLAQILSSLVKIAAYRRGYPLW
jgi:predicted membrane channel-forming protein YqfA (hemolysin III family)